MEFNINHAFIVGISLNRKSAKIIDEIYYADENKYYDAYLKKGLYSDNLKRIFSMKTEDRINKLSGIIEANRDSKSLVLTEKIIRAIHPSIVNFVKNSNVVNLDTFMMKYQTYNYGEEEQFSIGIALMYLAYKKGKKFTGTSYINFVIGKWESYIIVLRSSKELAERFNKVDNSKEVLSSINEGYDLFKIDKNKEIDESLEAFIGDYLERITYEKMGLDYSNFLEESKNIDVSVYQNARDEMYKEKSSLAGYIGSFSRYLKSLGLDSSDIFIDTNFDNSDLENIFREFYYGTKYNGVSESDRKLYIVTCMFIYNLVEVYKECKDMYLNKLLQEKHGEILEIEEKIANKKKIVDLEIERHKKKNKEITSENKILKQKIKELERENARLSGLATKNSQEIKDLTTSIKESNEIIEDLKQECNSLLEVSITKDDDVSLEDKINYINKYKIGIFGGMTNIKNLSNKLSNVSFYNSQNQDISSIANLDAIFISYEFFNHAFTKKINSAIRKYNTKRRYISGTNEELIINSIYSELLNFNK